MYIDHGTVLSVRSLIDNIIYTGGVYHKLRWSVDVYFIVQFMNGILHMNGLEIAKWKTFIHKSSVKTYPYACIYLYTHIYTETHTPKYRFVFFSHIKLYVGIQFLYLSSPTHKPYMCICTYIWLYTHILICTSIVL